MRVHFLQTSDEIRYSQFLGITSRTVHEYCKIGESGNFTCEAFLGVVRGFHPWQASYNRIPLLQRIADSGYKDWVCYIDADAYIQDLSFDITQFLKDKTDTALIAAPGGPDVEWWNVNDGVFLLNLGHPIALNIVREWNNLFRNITDAQLLERREWWPESHDQTLLWESLKRNPEAEACMLIDKGPQRILNYQDGAFVRQILRTHGDMRERLRFARMEVSRVLGPSKEEQFVRALYRVLLMRDPDPAGFDEAVCRLWDGQATFESAIEWFASCDEFKNKAAMFVERHASTLTTSPRGWRPWR